MEMPECIELISKIKKIFEQNEGEYVYQNQRNNTVTCSLIEDGIEVTCLNDSGHKNFLPWGVFWASIEIMQKNNGVAKRGSAQGGRLGSNELPFDSVEGYVAHVIYGKKDDDSVFQRISPIAHILIASGVCIDQRADLQLVN